MIIVILAKCLQILNVGRLECGEGKEKKTEWNDDNKVVCIRKEKNKYVIVNSHLCLMRGKKFWEVS